MTTRRVEQVMRDVGFPRMRKVKITLKTIDNDLATVQGGDAGKGGEERVRRSEGRINGPL
jgi:hypothetical protein